MGRIWSIARGTLYLILGTVKLALLAYCCLRAYRIRMHAVNKFGYVIHEFDPWFNFRAAQQLSKVGLHKFFTWYDYSSWYPIGRPVGTTIYPGMQMVSVGLWRMLKEMPKGMYKIPRSYLPAGILPWLPGHGTLAYSPLTLNQVCCLVPAWFGSLATLLMGLLASEASESTGAGVVAAAIMAVIPAHIKRSYAGEFENEAVAISFFVATLWLWCRSIRTPKSWPFAVLAGLAYVCAAATWGGYIFINNLVALHAATLVASGKYNTSIYRSYTLYFVVGTAGATQVPVIGWTPLRSMEQMPSLLVFVIYQMLELCDTMRRRRQGGMSAGYFFFFRVGLFLIAGALVATSCFFLLNANYFMPWTSRIRSLFLKHHKTGNPLVDSVAEHHAAQWSTYERHLHHPRYAALIGLVLCWHQRTPAKYLPVLYAVVAYIFSLKMSRLIIICGPIVSMLAGYPIGILFDWCLEQVVALFCGKRPRREEITPQIRTGGMGSIIRTVWASCEFLLFPQEMRDTVSAIENFHSSCPRLDRILRAMIAVAIMVIVRVKGEPLVIEFVMHSDNFAMAVSNPQIVFEASAGNGKPIIVDDYLKSYEWLKKNTPKDARIMAWWDYGYQITGVSGRTSLADGNTWNHEHIATLGRTLTSPEKKAHNVMRHLADYVLVWADGIQGKGHDLGKSPHLARIGNSVFPDLCGAQDPLCRKFGFDAGGQPTPMMRDSFLYKAVKHRKAEGVKLNPKLFEEVLTSKYGIVRIYKVLNVSQESKAWVADPANRVCDAPGSWYCVGQYPPALKPLIDKRQNFAQLEDFNRKGQKKSAYTSLIEQEREL